MASKFLRTFDAAGWPFFVAAFVLFLAPSIFTVYRLTVKDTTVLVRLGLGCALAAVAAGFTAWLVNTIVQRASHKRRIADRKKNKKRLRS